LTPWTAKRTRNYKPNSRGIFNAVLAQLDDAEETAFSKIVQYISHINPSSATADAVADALYNILNAEYNLKISSTQFKDMLRSQTEKLYESLVKDDPYMPRVDFSLPDRRAMQFLANSDQVYLGKYINDAELKRDIVEYIRTAYLENGNAIGNSPKELNAFMAAFREQLQLSRWKVRQIIDTTVSNARVFGQVNGLRAAGAKTFEVAGPDDNKTCEFCREMIGRVFDVATEIKRQDQLFQAGPEAFSTIRPFLKGNMSLEDLSNATDEQLQAAGFTAPPYHPLCRHRLVAKEFYENLDEIPYSID
jgi:hypothetical protein